MPVESPTPVEPTPALDIELTPEAAEVVRLTAALAGTPDSSPFHSVLTQALADAEGMQALALAEVERQLERQSEESQALALAAANNLSDAVVERMLAAIDAKYAPAPEVEPTPEVVAPVASGRRAIGPNTAARNADVAATMAAPDSALALRAVATIDAYYAGDHAKLSGVHPLAGTRFASIVAAASQGAGVANYADYVTLVTAVRQRLALAPYSLPSGGQSAADFPWTTGTGAHADNGPKGADTLRKKFSDFRALALCADGRFRLALAGTPDVRFVHADAAALAAFKGGAAAAPVAPAAAPTKPDAPAKPHVPTAPSSIALPTGGLARTLRCQHCQARNIVGEPKCGTCQSEDWQAS